MNVHEIALAARFVEALDASNAADLVDPAALSRVAHLRPGRGRGRAGPRSQAASAASSTACASWGCRSRSSNPRRLPAASAPALFLKVILTDAKTGETRGRIVVSSCSEPQRLAPLGKVAFRENSSISVLDGATLSKAIDRAIAGAFVTVKPARRTVGQHDA